MLNMINLLLCFMLYYIINNVLSFKLFKFLFLTNTRCIKKYVKYLFPIILLYVYKIKEFLIFYN